MSEPIVVDSMVRIPLGILSDKHRAEIQRKLTLRLPDGGAYGFGGKGGVMRLFRMTPTHIEVPRNWPHARDLMRNVPVVDRRSNGLETKLRFNGTYRPGQKDYVDDLLDGLHDDGFGGIGCAGCGFGKTVTMMPVLAALNRTTVILVHKEFLLEQWATACRTFLGVDPGIVQGDRCEYKGKQIVLAMVQTLASRTFEREFYDYFGIVVTDEVHRVAAPTWSDAVSHFSAKLRIGCTATPRRGDKMEDVFFWHMGEVVATGHGDFLDCVVTRVVYEPRLEPNDYYFRGKPNLGKLITKLARIDARTALLVRIIAKAVRAGRKVMVLSDRVEHVADIVKRLKIMFQGASENYTVGIYGAGSTKKAKAERDAAAVSDVLGSTWPMAKEGLDLPCYDTLVMATPKADIEQAAGRIRRLFEGKKQPHIVDVVDNVPFLHPIAGKRARYYYRHDMNKNAWPVHVVE